MMICKEFGEGYDGYLFAVLDKSEERIFAEEVKGFERGECSDRCHFVLRNDFFLDCASIIYLFSEYLVGTW